jgi:TonB-dependent starch-binding outer membrane protein SusC
MKLTGFLILVTLVQVSASVYSQNTLLSLSMKNSSLKDVFREIEKQSEFTFLYNNSKIDVDREVSVEFKSSKVEDILDKVLNGSGIAYVVIEKQIVLAGKDQLKSAVEAAQQQNKKIIGKITDSVGNPLPGVTVVLKGTTTGIITDSNGNYLLTNIPENAILQFSFVGMKSQEVAVRDKTAINITLYEETIAIEEVVAIGYGTASRKDFVGSVSSVKVEDSPISLLPNLNALEALKGSVAGLNIGAVNTAGGEPSMLIRGQKSISGLNDPLIVLDGVIYMGNISDINPSDIATYSILKDAVSAAAYGSRSANGVISITTKKGSSGKPVITFNTTSGIQKWQNKPQLMKGAEWLTVSNLRHNYDPGDTGWMTQYNVLDNYNAGKETDWLSVTNRTGSIQEYQVGVSGGTQNVNYYFSSAFNDNKGVIVGDDFTRFSLLGKVHTNITSWLKVGWDVSYSKLDYSGYQVVLNSIINSMPYGTMYRDDQGHLEKYPYTQSGVNPLWGINDGTRENSVYTNNFNLNAYAVIDVPWVKGLSFKMSVLTILNNGFTGNFANENYFVKEGFGLDRYAPSTVVGFLSSANGSISNTKTNSYVFDNILNYKNTFNKHSIEATLVATRDYKRYQQVVSTGSNFAANGNTSLSMWGLHKATVQQVNLNIEERANIGYLGRFNYSFNDKYFITTSYRRDGASVFGDNSKWADFAAFGTAWKISSEQFMKGFKPLNSLKLKLLWGQNGNQGIGPYGTLSSINNGASASMRYEFSNVPGGINYGLIQSTMGNSYLGWEKTESWNTGFESDWLNQRISVDLDVYSMKTTDQIFVRNIPVMTGFKTIYASMGQVNNLGVELTVTSTNIRTKDLTWHTAITYSKNKNKLVKLYGEDKNGDGKEDDDVANSLFIGKSLGAIYGYEQIGIVQESDTAYMRLSGALAGYPKYRDIDGIPGITAEDRKILGYTKENFRLNMSNTVSYKNFELYAMFTGIFGGNDYFLKSNKDAYTVSSGWNYQNLAGIPYWTPENMSNVYPAVNFNSTDSRYIALQSRGFVRLQDVSLSYKINQRWLKAARISSMKIFFIAKNLATITNWSGDPETGAAFLETYPVPSTYSIGANISF